MDINKHTQTNKHVPNSMEKTSEKITQSKQLIDATAEVVVMLVNFYINNLILLSLCMLFEKNKQYLQFHSLWKCDASPPSKNHFIFIFQRFERNVLHRIKYFLVFSNRFEYVEKLLCSSISLGVSIASTELICLFFSFFR